MPFSSANEALDALGDPHLFERLCSTLLTWSYPNLKPYGGSHDGGRDSVVPGELFFDGDIVWAQYSLERRWTSKLRREFSRIKEDATLPRRLIFCFAHPPQPRRSDMERLRAEARELGVDLELNGRPWLLARLDGPNADVAARLLHVIEQPASRLMTPQGYAAWMSRGVPGFAAPLVPRAPTVKSGRSSTRRVIALVGEGGVGKSRRALEMLEAMPGDRLCLVDGQPFDASVVRELAQHETGAVLIDDAHRRPSLGGVALVVSDPAYSGWRLLITCRRDQWARAARELSVPSDEIDVRSVRSLTPKEVERLLPLHRTCSTPDAGRMSNNLPAEIR